MLIEKSAQDVHVTFADLTQHPADRFVDQIVIVTEEKGAERLKAQGASDAAIARIHAPIGLPIGAVSPSEIAVSIMAEITAQLRLPKDGAA